MSLVSGISEQIRELTPIWVEKFRDLRNKIVRKQLESLMSTILFWGINFKVVKHLRKSKFAKFALDEAEMAANDYPPQMRDLVIKENVEFFIGRTVAIMAMDIMYSGKMLKPLTEDEKVTANYIMFSDVLPK